MTDQRMVAIPEKMFLDFIDYNRKSLNSREYLTLEGSRKITEDLVTGVIQMWNVAKPVKQ